MARELLHNRKKSRFEIRVDGDRAGYAHYKLRNGVAMFDHTVVRPEFGGQGLGTVLVRHALEGARAEGWRFGATCPFVLGFLERHPEFAADTV